MISSIGSLARQDRPGRHALTQRLLQAGFWFFLLKGLLWLTVPALLHRVVTG